MAKLKNVELFNMIMQDCSASTRDRLGQASSDNIKAITDNMFSGNSYQAEFNDFVNVLLNKICFTLFRINNFNNKFKDLIYYDKPIGQVIEEITVQPAVSENYQPTTITENSSIDPYRITKPDVKSMYLSNTNKRKYRVTVFIEQLKKAFNNEYGLSTLIDEIVNSLQKGSTIDEYNLFKDLLNSMIVNTKFAKQPNQTITNNYKVQDSESALLFVQTVKNTIAQLLEPNSCFNESQVITQMTTDDIIIFIRSDVANVIQTALNSSAFNPQDLNFLPSGVSGTLDIRTINDFGGVGAYKRSGSAGNYTYTALHRVYDTYGKFTHWSETSGGASYSGQKYFLNNYMLKGNKLEEDIACIICDKRRPVIANELTSSNFTINNEALYSNYVLHVWQAYGFSTFANFITIKEPFEIAKGEPNVKKPVEINTDDIDTSKYTFEKVEGTNVGETFTFKVTQAKEWNTGDYCYIAKSLLINGVEYPLKNSTTDGNFFIRDLTLEIEEQVLNIQVVEEMLTPIRHNTITVASVATNAILIPMKNHLNFLENLPSSSYLFQYKDKVYLKEQFLRDLKFPILGIPKSWKAEGKYVYINKYGFITSDGGATNQTINGTFVGFWEASSYSLGKYNNVINSLTITAKGNNVNNYVGADTSNKFIFIFID